MGEVVWQNVLVHNAADLADVGGVPAPQRVPESVRRHLGEMGRGRAREAAGVELRFVADGPVELDLSVPRGDVSGAVSTDAVLFHGPFQHWNGRAGGDARRTLGTTPTTVRIEPPTLPLALDAALNDSRADAASWLGGWSPRVARLMLPPLAGPVLLHAVRPDAGVTVRPPTGDEQPRMRVVFYGTSITHGAGATAAHLTYPAVCAAMLGADAINLGLGGACLCEPAIVDHVASRGDWHAAVLPLSVNMIGLGDDEFAARVRYAVTTIAGRNPGRPVLAVTLWPHFADAGLGLDGRPDADRHAKAARFRQHLRDAVADADSDDLRLLEGPDLLTRPSSLSTDLLHPGDHALMEMGRRLADALRPLLA